MKIVLFSLLFQCLNSFFNLSVNKWATEVTKTTGKKINMDKMLNINHKRFSQEKGNTELYLWSVNVHSFFFQLDSIKWTQNAQKNKK